jgi:molybdopterin synthase sulfur carrier subunit
VDETTVMVSASESIRVRYWAAAKAAARVSEDWIDTSHDLSLTEVRTRAVALHPHSGLGEVLAACSTLIGDQPVGSASPDDVRIAPGQCVEFLPPFAGG